MNEERDADRGVQGVLRTSPSPRSMLTSAG
jgi:hypothetical protein